MRAPIRVSVDSPEDAVHLLDKLGFADEGEEWVAAVVGPSYREIKRTLEARLKWGFSRPDICRFVSDTDWNVYGLAADQLDRALAEWLKPEIIISVTKSTSS
jgi:hypothetical protein